MAKGSGNTRRSNPRRSPVVIRLRDSYGEYGREVIIYGNDRSVKYDEDWHRFTPVVDRNGLSVLSTDDVAEWGLPDTDDYRTLMAEWSDYKDNYRDGRDVQDESFTFITKGGKLQSAHYLSELPKINPRNIIFIEKQDAMNTRVWYNKTKQEYKDIIKKISGYKVL